MEDKSTQTQLKSACKKSFSSKLMRNIHVMENTTIMMPAGWVEWDTWIGNDSDC